MKAVGIDSATHTGLAYIDANGEKRCETIDVRKTGAMSTAVKQMVVAGVTDAFIEIPFVGVNPKTALKLQTIVANWDHTLTSLGIEVHEVNNMSWKHAELTVAGHFPPTGPEQKAQAKWVAENVHGFEPQTEDEADATCIWDYGQIMLDRGLVEDQT